MTTKIPKRVTTALLQSLAAGVVPRNGLEHIAVGRTSEISALLSDLDDVVADGGASFRLISGRYGSGKSFMGQLIRNYALQRNFVVADADLSPERRLTGSKGEGLNLYRELLNNMSTRTRPDGNAFAAILERWISDLQTEVIQQDSLSPTDPGFGKAVELRIRAAIDRMEGLVHGFDFATVINAYWQGHLAADEQLQGAALRWLRGEYALKTEAREALGVRVIIDDASWYDYVKLLANFVQQIGYKGLILFLDEAVNLYKISHTVSRHNNYERLLTLFNDTLQGKASYLGIIIGTTPQMVEDTKRGLFSYEALRTRLEESRYARDGLRDLSGPLLRLDVLESAEIFLLLKNLRTLHGIHHKYEPAIDDQQIQGFMNEILTRLGAEQMLTPREVVRDFIAVLNILQQNPEITFENLVSSDDFQISTVSDDPEVLTPANEIHDDVSETAFANFQL